MGLFKKIKKAFKKVTRGIKKAVKGVVKGVKKVVKKISSSKILKALAIAAAVVVTGGAAVAAFTGGTAASGTFAGWMMNASQAVTGGALFGTGATGVTGALQTVGNVAAQTIASPFKAVGTALGSAAATVTDFTGLTTEASRTGFVPSGLTDAEISQVLTETPSSVAVKTSQETTAQQLARTSEAAFESGSAIGTSTGIANPPLSTQTFTSTGGTLNIPQTLPAGTSIGTSSGVQNFSYVGTAGSPAAQLSQTVPAALDISPVEASASVAEKLSLTEKYPKTTEFLSGAAGSAANTVFGAYVNSLMTPTDTRGREGGTLGEEGASRRDPIGIYSNALDINPNDFTKHFTFGNTVETGNMPLFQQQTVEVT
jgi:hypothetical protein